MSRHAYRDPGTGRFVTAEQEKAILRERHERWLRAYEQRRPSAPTGVAKPKPKRTWVDEAISWAGVLIVWAVIVLIAAGMMFGGSDSNPVCPANSSSDLSYCEVDDTYYPEYPEADY